MAGRPPPRPRRDAELNRERILDAAVSLMRRQGRHVPLAEIAAEAGVGVGTLYRSYPDREALLHALEYRAYGLLNHILDEIGRRDIPGLGAIREYLERSLDVGDQLILPLHGAPPLASTQAVLARREINRRLEEFIERGQADGSIRAPVNATDVIVFSALITQPLPHGPSWPLIAGRQLAIFVSGLAGSDPAGMPGPAVSREDIETAFALRRSPIITLMTPVDVTKPNIARMYDYWLGGKDNFEADREAAEAIRQRRPNIAEQALDNKKFQTRAISYVAGQGVRQFLDIGSGLPTSPVRAEGAAPRWLATHEAARAVVPDAMVGYVDYDPVAVAHSQALLASGSRQVVAVDGDLANPQAILAHPDIRRAGLRLDVPACVILCCVLHFLDAGTAHDVVASFARSLAPGSYLIISIGWAQGQDGHDFASTYNAQDGSRIYAHSRDEITAMFVGTELVPPGIVDCATWRVNPPPSVPAGQTSMILGAAARRP